ncbi:MAG: ferredoxin family protein [Calditrichia bacterium]
MTYIITEPCEGVCNTACVEVCPVECIYPPPDYGFRLSEEEKQELIEAGEQLYIHPEECIDCGACQPECPVDAIFPDDEVPAKWKHFIDKNYQRFGLEVREEPLGGDDFDFQFE